MIIFKPSACSFIPAKFAKRMEQYATSAPGMPNSRSTSLYGPRYEEELPNQSPPPSLSPSPNRLKPSLPVVPLSPRHLRSEPFPVELKFTITRAMTKISAMPTISEIRFSKAISIWSPFRNMLIGSTRSGKRIPAFHDIGLWIPTIAAFAASESRREIGVSGASGASPTTLN